MDSLTPAQRSERMSRVRSRNTKPELVVRSVLHRMGYRFRLDRSDLPGSPDLTLPRYRCAVFVHGCFWHGHPECNGGRLPKTNVAFWTKKISENQERDRRAIAELKQLGWRVHTVWACETRRPDELGYRLDLLIKYPKDVE
jgi:DNA mismatch endonuclease (patch repair protein)